MIEFFTMIFFGKTILLTPNEIDIDDNIGGYEIPLDDPLVAISGGASVQVDVTNMFKSIENYSVGQLREVTTKRFRDGVITATLMGDDVTIRLTYKGGTSVDKDSVRIILEADGVPKDIEFNRMILETSIPLQHVTVFWKNYSK